MVLTLVVVGALVASIALGYVKKINIGLFAIVFGYLIGVFGLDLSPRDIIAMWPTNFFFLLFSICLFYGFAADNGTLDAIARRFVYPARKQPYLIPFALYLTCVVIAGIGPGAPAVFALMGPIIMSVAKETGMKPLLGAIILVAGANTGAWSSIAVNGLVTRALIEDAGYGAVAGRYGGIVWFNVFTTHLLGLIAGYVVLGGHALKSVVMDHPPTLTRDQKVNLRIIAFVVAGLIVPLILKLTLPGHEGLEKLASKMDITMLSLIGSILALFFRVGNEKRALSHVPWSLIILLCGVGILIAVASKAGTVQLLSHAVSSRVSMNILPHAMGGVAFAMGFFSPLLGVVLPTLFPLVPGLISSNAGLSPTVMFSIISLGAVASGFSPFSTAGALSMAGLQTEDDRRTLFGQLLCAPFVFFLFFLFLLVLGIII